MCAQWCTTVAHLHHLMYLCMHIFNANVTITVCIYKASLNVRFHLHRTKHKNDYLSSFSLPLCRHINDEMNCRNL